jgi:murein DD-endopeptidase MepM/ murein hydrolase activator NlpD
VRTSRALKVVSAPIAIAALLAAAISATSLAATKNQEARDIAAAKDRLEATRLSPVTVAAETNQDLALARAVEQTTRSLVRQQKKLTKMAKIEAAERKAELARLAAERLMRESRAMQFRIVIPKNVNLPATFTSVKRSPLPGTRTTAYFGQRGWRWHGGVHTGLDFDGYYGQSVKAAADGVVIARGWDGSYGYSVLIAHGGQVVTRYAHLSSIAVPLGAKVKAGTHIGKVGATGNASGTHLHFEVAIRDRLVNPFDWLRS